jgi:hypothetical protein
LGQYLQDVVRVHQSSVLDLRHPDILYIFFQAHCHGDSGAPIVIGYAMIALVSAGRNCEWNVPEINTGEKHLVLRL